MKNMTYSAAIENAIAALSILDSTECDRDATIERLEALKVSLAKRGERSDEAKAKASAKRKENNAKERRALCAQVLPILREAAIEGGTAKEIFERCKDMLPTDFTANKVQYMLLHEMANEVDKIETKNKPNIYKMKRV